MASVGGLSVYSGYSRGTRRPSYASTFFPPVIEKVYGYVRPSRNYFSFIVQHLIIYHVKLHAESADGKKSESQKHEINLLSMPLTATKTVWRKQTRYAYLSRHEGWSTMALLGRHPERINTCLTKVHKPGVPMWLITSGIGSAPPSPG